MIKTTFYVNFSKHLYSNSTTAKKTQQPKFCMDNEGKRSPYSQIILRKKNYFQQHWNMISHTFLLKHLKELLKKLNRKLGRFYLFQFLIHLLIMPKTCPNWHNNQKKFLCNFANKTFSSFIFLVALMVMYLVLNTWLLIFEPNKYLK